MIKTHLFENQKFNLLEFIWNSRWTIIHRIPGCRLLPHHVEELTPLRQPPWPHLNVITDEVENINSSNNNIWITKKTLDEYQPFFSSSLYLLLLIYRVLKIVKFFKRYTGPWRTMLLFFSDFSISCHFDKCTDWKVELLDIFVFLIYIGSIHSMSRIFMEI